MMVSANRFRSIGWIALLLVCGALVMVLAFRVNALRSQVHRTEMQIVSLRKEKLYLETEVETRANQQQLKLWNDVEFGYVAPTASQYLSSERQLAAFSKPDAPDAPTPIRVASADDAVAAQAAFPSIVSRLTGEPDIGASDDHAAAAAEAPAPRESTSADDHAAATAGLGAKLAMVGSAKKVVALAGSGKAHGAAKSLPGKAVPKTVMAKNGAKNGAKPAAKLAAAPKTGVTGKAAKPGKAAKAGKTSP